MPVGNPYGGMQGLGSNGTGFYSSMAGGGPLQQSLLGAQPMQGGGSMGGMPTGGMSPLTMLLASRLLAQGAGGQGQRAPFAPTTAFGQQRPSLQDQLSKGVPGMITNMGDFAAALKAAQDANAQKMRALQPQLTAFNPTGGSVGPGGQSGLSQDQLSQILQRPPQPGEMGTWARGNY